MHFAKNTPAGGPPPHPALRPKENLTPPQAPKPARGGSMPPKPATLFGEFPLSFGNFLRIVAIMKRNTTLPTTQAAPNALRVRGLLLLSRF